jgi:putative sterol carrier protein
MTLDELFNIMTEKAGAVELTSPASASIVLDITGDKPMNWLVKVDGSKIFVNSNASSEEKPDLKVTTSGDVLLKVACRELNPTMAFFTGKIKVQGDIGLISHLKNLWPGS